VNKAQLIDSIVDASDMTKSMAGQALDAVIASITKALASGDSVALVGFGTFSVKSRAARTGRNPKTGEPIHIAEAVIPNFKAGKLLKDAVTAGATSAKAALAEEALA
jgi:DNA-binding protein HU-beta